ncbi:hypothetical protein [Candidatus Sororendozoicomonas aggregata]|uniref:hypothetical protein n=1 Tax=Candidatus Sororendozoicomonas aggregata TaxID=3073239 RepID=UPI002ED35ACC
MSEICKSKSIKWEEWKEWEEWKKWYLALLSTLTHTSDPLPDFELYWQMKSILKIVTFLNFPRRL